MVKDSFDNIATHDEVFSCKFCDIQKRDTIRPVSDTVLYENNYFYVIPALGCFLNNYIMIVSKRHVNSMSYLSDFEKKSLEDITNHFRSLMKNIYGFYPIVFEHGAANDTNNKSACCIMHAHIHIVPYKLNNEKEMVNALDLKLIENYDAFYSLTYDKPYLFYMDNSGSIYCKLTIDTAFPSQIIRKWIAQDIGMPEKWDWRVYPFEENIKSTIDGLLTEIKNKRLKDKRFKYVYYCRAMDGLDKKDIQKEYDYIQSELQKQGRILVNPFSNDDHNILEINKHNANIVVAENLKDISKADCVIVNLSIKGHTYVGCIAEMVYAKIQGCYVIVICGENDVNKRFHTLYHSDVIMKDLDELFCSREW